MIPNVTREKLLEAMKNFDQELRNQSEWIGWEENKAHKYAISHENRFYPVKKVVSIATGVGVDTFSGGGEANGYAQQRGFSVVPLRENGSDQLRQKFEKILANYNKVRSNGEFGRENDIWPIFESAQQILESSMAVKNRPTLNVNWSIGKGNWAHVPWIAFLDSRETKTTREGIYCVYLFREDMSGIYLTFNQGVTTLIEEQGRKTAEETLRSKATELRERSRYLLKEGFQLDDEIDLRTEMSLGTAYEKSTIAYKFYPQDSIPSDEKLFQNLETVLKAYDDYLGDSKPEKRKEWVFQANPKKYNLKGALQELKQKTWLVSQHKEDIGKGEKVYLWESGPEGGIVAVARTLTDPLMMEADPAEQRYQIDTEKFSGERLRVRIDIEKVLEKPLKRAELETHPVLSSMAVIKSFTGSNFALTEEEAEALERLIAGVEVKADLPEICQSFSSALRNSHISFGSRHDELVRAFVASLATKRFVILTGLSGSGKTQIAIKFGEWLGDGKCLVVPVRPDWTGSEAIFGYEDAIQPLKDGRRAWHVTEVLGFMIKAAHDPQNPYVLVLDEMNLAHVERYFADALSGMESMKDCLPNLQEEKDKQWRLIPDQREKIPFPGNLFIVGTVNIDETTYMFSPKVLDRANTFEFRVGTDELSEKALKPVPCPPGPQALRRGFLRIATDDGWHLNNPASGLTSFTERLGNLHGLLSSANFEFGHRVFYEAIRFAAMHEAAGGNDVDEALDLQVMQKILPRLHGSRRRLEPTLCLVGRFCFDLTAPKNSESKDPRTLFDPLSPPAGEPKLPLSFDKVQRMTQSLRANQFASFTD